MFDVKSIPNLMSAGVNIFTSALDTIAVTFFTKSDNSGSVTFPDGGLSTNYREREKHMFTHTNIPQSIKTHKQSETCNTTHTYTYIHCTRERQKIA